MHVPTAFPLAAALLAAPAAPVSAPATPQAAEEEAWQLHNTVDGVVERHIITRKEILDRILGPDSTYTISSREDLERAHAEVFEQAVMEELRLQAGESLGSALGNVDMAVRRQMAEERRTLGLFEYQEQLAERRIDPSREREERTEELHRQLWEGAVTGDGISSDGRVARDQYLRPGLLRVLYEENRDMLRDPPPAVRIEILLVTSAAAGGLESARAVCAEQREEIAAGKDFALAVEEYGAQYRSSGGDAGWLEVPLIRDPEVAAFVEGAETGDLSPVLDAWDGSRIAGAQVLRVAEVREGGEAPSFSDARVQQYLTNLHRRLLRERRLERAERELAREAYIWRLTP